jgi:PAS domain S-box-containing protein
MKSQHTDNAATIKKSGIDIKYRRWPQVRIFLAVIAALLATSVATGQEPNRSLRFVGNDKIPPIIFVQNGKPTGLVVDLAYAVAKKAHLRIRVEPMDWSEAQSLVSDGKADALLQMNPTPEREKLYDFSDPLLESSFHIFRKNTRLEIQGLTSLYGKRVGVERGGFPIQYLKRYHQIHTVIIPNWRTGFEMLGSEKLDAVLVDRWVGEYELYLNKISNVKVVEPSIFTDHSRIAVKKGNVQLLDRINYGIREIGQDGTQRRILEKWQAEEVVQFTRESIQRMILWAALVCIAMLIVIALRSTAHARTTKKLNLELAMKNEMLLEAQKNLEQKIEQRTAELKQANSELQTEVAERNQAEEALRESEARMQMGLEVSRSFAFEWDTATDQVLRSNSCAAILGLSGDEIEHDTGQRYFQRVHPDDRDRFMSMLGELRAGADTYKTEYRITRGDGTTAVVEESARGFFDASGKLQRLIGVTVDITERKQAEEALRDSHAELAEFNKLMVGRELRVIELKNEINRMCEEANQPPRYEVDKQ